MTKAELRSEFRAERTTPANPGPDVLNRGEKAAESLEGPATRKDLVDLHNRLLKMVSTMDIGLRDSASQSATKDREAIVQRLEDMTEAVDSLEGVVRIEITPYFHKALNDVFEERNIGVQSRLGSRLFAVALIGIAFAAGVYFAEPALEAWLGTLEYSTQFF